MCVRIVKANNLDLTRFQFDYDLTFAVVFMNSDGTIYGRYGTRSSVKEAEKDMSLAGLAKSMSAAIALHEKYPANKKELAGKQPIATKFKEPNDFPSLRGRFKEELDFGGAVSKSCLHCHQVRDAERQIYRNAGKPIPDRLLFPNPSASAIGLTLNPKQRATITKVERDSPGAKSGLQPGDEILRLAGQPILSHADIQWALHNAESSDRLAVTVRRSGRIASLQLRLEPDWRHRSDISWRVSSWPLRRMGTGGLLFSEATAEQRRSAKVRDDELALVVKHVGQYGPHAAAKRAGFKKGDLVVSFDGQTRNMSTSELLAYSVQKTKPGQRIPVTVFRSGKRIQLKLPMQR